MGMSLGVFEQQKKRPKKGGKRKKTLYRRGVGIGHCSCIIGAINGEVPVLATIALQCYCQVPNVGMFQHEPHWRW